MFKKIWSGWKDGLLKAYGSSVRKAFLMALIGIVLLLGVGLPIVNRFGLPAWAPWSQLLLCFSIGGVVNLVLIPVLVKFHSQYHRNGPGTGNRLRALWQLVKKTRLVRWSIDGLWLSAESLDRLFEKDANLGTLLVGGLFIGALVGGWFFSGRWGATIYYSGLLFGTWPLIGALHELASRIRGAPRFPRFHLLSCR